MGQSTSRFGPPYPQFLSFNKGTVSTLDDNLPPFPLLCKHQPPSVSAGDLDGLPMEVLHNILPHLDIRSLINLRLANRRTAEVVDSHPQYKAVFNHTRNALRGILAIDTGRWITLATLYKKLCESKCHLCGAEAGYLNLITCRRFCFRCLSGRVFCHPLPLSLASNVFALPMSEILTLPHMMALPGTYYPSETITEPMVLVDYGSALIAGVETHGSEFDLLAAVGELGDEYVAILAGRKRFVVAEGAELAAFAAVSRVPWLNKKTREFEDLPFCHYCLQHPEDSQGHIRSTWRVQYTRKGLVDHCKTCQFRPTLYR